MAVRLQEMHLRRYISPGYYNVHRWYTVGVGRYSRVDPLGRDGDPHPYLYARGNPNSFADLIGEKARVCCTPADPIQKLIPGRQDHCSIQVQDDDTGVDTTYSLHRVKGKGCRFRDDGFDRSRLPQNSTKTDCGPWNTDGCVDPCIEQQHLNYPNPSDYQATRGPNSNSYARTLAQGCGLEPPPFAGTSRTPGWNKDGRPAQDKRFVCPEVRQ